MTEPASFRALLGRLCRLRGLDSCALARQASMSAREIQEVLGGAAPPEPSLIRRVVPVLQWQAADLFVMAGLPVPGDLAPRDAQAGPMLPALVGHALRLQPDQRRELREHVQGLPQQGPGQEQPVAAVREQDPPGLGPLVVRLLYNRNLTWLTSAKLLFRLTGLGPLAASTVGAIGRGRKELTPELLAGFATVLGIRHDDLAVLAAVNPIRGAVRVEPAVADVAELLWDVRRLSAAQVRDVCDIAQRKELRRLAQEVL